MTTSDKKIRIVIADDMPGILDAVAQRLSQRYEVVGRASDGAALVEYVRNLKPDLIVTDVSMPKLTGLAALQALREQGIQIPAVILTVHEDDDVIKEARSFGAMGFVLKRRLVSDLCLAVHETLNGRTFVSESTDSEPIPVTDLKTLPFGGRSTEILLDRSGLFIARSEVMEWAPGMAPGCQQKDLFVDADQRSITSLVRMQPGTHFPAHRHGGPEEFFLISGDLVVEGQTLKPGDYCRAASATIHNESYTKSGCDFLLRTSKHNKIIGAAE